MKLQSILYDILNEVGDLKSIEPYKYKLMYHVNLKNKKIKTHLGYFKDSDDDEVVMKMEPVDHVKFYSFLSPKIPNSIQIDANTLLYYVRYVVNNNENQEKKSSFSQLLRIVKTLVDFIVDVIEKNRYENVVIFIGAAAKTGMGHDSQKFRFYERVVQNVLPNSYRYGIGSAIGNTGKHQPVIYIQKN